MNDIEYILRIILQARDQTAAAFKTAREELRHFVSDVDSSSGKLDKFNNSMKTMETNMAGVTEKIREWRSVIQGMGDDSSDASKSVSSLNKEVENSVKTTARATKGQAALRQEAGRLRREYGELQKQQKSGILTDEQAIDAYKKLGRELDTVANKLDKTKQFWRQTNDLSRGIKQAAQQIIDSQRAIVAAEEKRVQDEEALLKRVNNAHAESVAQRKKDNEQLEKDEQALLGKLNKIYEQRVADRHKATEQEAKDEQVLLGKLNKITEQRRANRRKDLDDERDYAALVEQAGQRLLRTRRMLDERPKRGRDRAEFDPQLIAQLQRLGREYSTLSRHARASERDQDHFATSLVHVRNELRNLSSSTHEADGFMSHLKQMFDHNTGSVAAFDNQLRGLLLLGAVGFAQQLITVLGGLAGSFLAVASSAAQAAAAIGGMFVAGIAEALPMVGIFAATMFRVKAVMDAVNQSQLLQQQQATKAATAGKKQADAADAIANAEDGLKSAHDGVAEAQDRLAEAQDKLGEARRQGRRELEDLIRAENDAKLAALGAALSQKEAQQALIAAQQRGDVEGIQRAQLAVLEAQSDAEDKLTQKRRASADAERGRRGGVEGMPGVKQAKKDIEDAQKAADKAADSVEKARRGVEHAKRQSDQASAGAETAAAKLNFLLAQLSPAEKRLYNAITNIQKLFREGVFRDITDTLVNSFARSIEKITRILQRPDILNTARKLSRGMSQEFNRIFDSFTSDKMVKQFERIAEQGRKNLHPLATIISRFGRSLANIAEEAGPALHDLLEFIAGLANQFLRLTNRKKDMEEFFKTGEKHFEAWIKLGLSVVNLFLAIAGAGGARTGLETINDATKAIDGLTKKVSDNREGVGKFFEDARHVTGKVVEVLAAAGVELGKSFTPERIDKFAKLLTDVVIPALGNVIRFLGEANSIVVEFAATPIGEHILKWGIAAFVLFNVFGKILSTVTALKLALDLGKGATKLVSSALGRTGARAAATGVRAAAPAGGLAEGFLGGGAVAGEAGAAAAGGGAAAALVPVAAVVAVTAAVVLLLKKFGLLDDAWKAIKDGASAFWKEVKPSLDDLIDSFGKLWDTIKKGEGPIGDAIDLLKPFFDVLVAVAKVVLPALGRALGRVFGGFIDVLTGVVDILSGDFDEGFKKLFGGITRMMTALPRMLFELAVEAGKAILEGLKAGFEAVGNVILDFIHHGWREVLDFFGISSPSKLAEDLGKSIVDGLRNGLRSLGRAISSAPRHAWTLFKRAFEGATDFGELIARRFVRGLKVLGGAIADAARWLWDKFRDAFPNAAKFGERIATRIVNGVKNLPGQMLDAVRKMASDLLNVGKTIGNAIWDGIKSIFGKAGDIGGSIVGKVKDVFGGGGDDKPAPRRPTAQPAQRGAPAKANVPIDADELKAAQRLWILFWRTLVSAASRGTDAIQREFRQMRIATSRSADSMYRAVRGSLADIEHSFEVRGARLVASWGDTWQSIKKLTFDGLNYIGHESNKALKGFGAKTVNFGLSAPPATGKAGGGWIGQKGQRGRDMGLYALGAGEAVLNWGHQKYVEPAMHAFWGFGLSDMFDRTGGTHAGPTGQPGFAEGGTAGNSRWNRLLAAANKVNRANFPYHLGGGHEQPAHFEPFDCSGSVSYVTQQAGYKVPTSVSGAMGSWGFPKGTGAVTVFFNPVHTFMRIGDRYFGTSGFARPNGGAGWFNQSPGPGYLAQFQKIHLPGIGKAGEFFSGVGGEIAKLIVKGPDSPIKEMVQKIFDKTVGAANEHIGEQSSQFTSDGQAGDIHTVAAGAGNIFKFFRQQGFTDAQAAGWVGNLTQESGLNPGAVQPGGPGRGLVQWGGGRFTALVNFAKQHGHDDWRDLGTQLAFIMHELRGSESGAYAAIKGAHSVEEATNAIGRQYERFGIQGDRSGPARAAYRQFAGKYAEGGIIPGGDGTPLNAIVHAGEWILNKGQQARAAALAGLSPSSLASMLGFHGGKGSYAGGGVLQVGDSLSVGMRDALKGFVKDLVSEVKKGIGSPEAFQVLKKNLKDTYRSVIFDVGTNDANAEVLGKSLKKAYGLLKKDQNLILGLVPGGAPDAKRKNEEIRQFAEHHARVSVVEANKLPTGADRIHLTNKGYAARAKLFAAKVKDAADSKVGAEGDDPETIVPLTTKQVREITNRALRKIVVNLRKVGRAFDVSATSIGTVEKWMDYATDMGKRLSGLSGRLATQRTGSANFERGLMGFLDGMEKLTGENGVFARLRTSIERRTAQFSRRAIFRRFGEPLAGRVVRERDDATVLGAQEELIEARRLRGDLTDERARIGADRDLVRKRLGRKGIAPKLRARLIAQANRLDQMYEEADQRVADNLQSIYEAQQAYLQAQLDAQQKLVDNLNSVYEKANAGQERLARRATALGDENALVNIGQMQRDLMQQQANDLQAQVAGFRNIGSEEANKAADQIEQQIADLTTQIFESIQQSIRDAADRINANAQRRQGHIDLGKRLLDALGVVGLVSTGSGGARTPFLNQLLGQQGITGGFSRSALLQASGANLRQQYGGLQGVLSQAQAQGNIGLIKDLTDQLAELEVSIQENSKELFNARIEEVTSTSDRKIHTNDLRRQLIEATGAITGLTDTATQLKLTQEDANTLQDTHNKLQALLNEAIANQDQEAIDRLTDQLLENEIAQANNTKAINDLTGATTQPQTFSSSAWQWFREAIFGGMGQVLPQYDPTGMGVNTGVAVSSNSTTNNTAGGTSTVNIYEAGQPVDITAVTSAIVFASKTAQ